MSGSLRYLLVLDFEATCGDDVKGVNEIIEFPTLVYDLEEDRVQSTFHEYVRPVVHPKLTNFCKDFTGITQDVVDVADPFPVVWERFQNFIRNNESLADPASFAFLTCGNWDLCSMLPRQLDLSENGRGLDASGDLLAPFNRSINLKDAFRRHYKLRYQLGMAHMLRRLKMELEGRHHSGIDDCRNILRIVQRMLADGWRPQDSISLQPESES
ncbi:exonuclease RNase T and DNA polymerase III [Fomitopsis serialis]|uniref:exonuclease RNase T and DNA polymerase III n=1 Tax=Fomitopsis serialis TaxID=139415 RepID=UPI00200847D3|nr:exonuclease RNase T and DNA polymerase III [Neoantrodia serialis]KAH9937101.1 exonuclease RNase T and DNA polymerase III [Neoantrodia serialis]